MDHDSSENIVPVGKSYAENVDYLNRKLGVPDNFDIVVHELSIGGLRAAIYSVNGMVETQVSSYVLESLLALRPAASMSDAFAELVRGSIVNLQVSQVQTMEEVLYAVLSGPMAILIEGQAEAFIVDARMYPAREPQEPDIERVTRGSRDGFTETLAMNTALIRRRLRDPNLRLKLLRVGKRSQTDVCLAYIEDITNLDLVEEIQKKIQGIKIDGIPMAEKSVEEFLLGNKFWNPYPRVRYTERPDVAAIHLLQGYVIIMVDTSPSVMIAPATFWSHVQHPEEYRQEPAVGAYLRWVRFVGIFAALFLLPLWLGAALNPQLLPEELSFIGVNEELRVPLFAQILIAEFGVDLLRLGTIHTPAPLGTALGLIAAFMLGDIAIRVGLFSPEVVMYIAIVSVGTFATPSYELGLANRLVRLFLIIMTGLFNFIGFGIGLIMVFLLLGRTKSFGVPYLWPLLPLDVQAMKAILVRSPVPMQNRRASVLKTQDQDRQP